MSWWEENGVSQEEYERFVRENPGDEKDEHRLKTALGQKTASDGGSGGDLDLDGDAKIDAGWIRIGDEGGGRWTQDADFAARYRAADPDARDAMVDVLQAEDAARRSSGGGGGGFIDTRRPGLSGPLSPVMSDGGSYRPATISGMYPASSPGEAPRPYQPFTGTYTAPTWTGGNFSFDPSKIAENPAYQVRLSDTIKAVDRGSAAKGLSFTPQAREELVQRVGALASDEIDAEFGRQYSTFGANRGMFESDRDFGRSSFLDTAGIHDTNESQRYGTERSNLLDTRALDSDLWGRGRTSRLDDRAWDTELWGRGRMDRNDQFARGESVWGMNRADRNDIFDQNYRLSDLVLRNRPRPA